MYLRSIHRQDHQRVADFLDARTMMLRWLVAFFRHGDELPRESEQDWSLWMDGGAAESPASLVAAHFFRTATTYVCAAAGADLGPLGELCEEELLPERLVGDLEVMARWRAAAPELFGKAARVVEVEVLAGDGGEGGEVGQVALAGFRAAAVADRDLLEEYGRLYEVEIGEEFSRDFESLIERRLVFVHEEAGRVQGFICSNLSDGRFVHGGSVYVHPAYRGRGVGRALARGLAARVREADGATAVLDVHRHNERALRAYRAAGYRGIGAGLEAQFAEGAWRGP